MSVSAHLRQNLGMAAQPRWPAEWVGQWVAADGKSVTIESSRGRVAVTVNPAEDAPPYASAQLLGGGTKLIDRVPGTCRVDDEGLRYLEVEAGTPGVGPTYRLYPAVEDAEGRRPAPDSAAIDAVSLIPQTVIGLYDDWDDDLGVPWAYPLEVLRRRG